MPTETDIQNAIRIEATRKGCRLFRNNVGVLKDAKGHRVAYGLCPGSSDLIGWTPRTITADDVGRTVAVFTAIEVKRPGQRMQPHQARFVEQVQQHGGIAGMADSVGRAVEIMKGHTR